MSCTIQDYGWKKNGNWVDSYCRATTTDTIAMQARIYFSQAYGSVYLYFSIKKPDNTIGWYRYGYTASAAGTYTWDVTVGQFSTGPGTYYINEVQITDSNINTICSASGTPNNCRTLYIISGANTINYSTFAKGDGSGGAVEFNSCTISPSIATGRVLIMNQVTINSPGTYTVRCTYRINGQARDVNSTSYYEAGTYWTFINTSDTYTANTTYEIVGTWFV